MTPEPDDQDSVGRIAARLGEAHQGTGMLAELRRLDPAGSLIAPSLQRMLVQYVRSGDPETLRRWALLVHCLALVSPQEGERHPFGHALFEAGYSDGRLSRLLAARGEEMLRALPRAMRFLRAKGVSVAPHSLWDFLNATTRPAHDASWADDARTRLARAYYKAEDATTRKQAEKGAAA